MNKMLTTYILSTVIGFAGTLAFNEIAKADEKPRFYYRHNVGSGKQAQSKQFTVTAQSPAATRTLQKYITDQSDPNYYFAPATDEFMLTSTFVFDASSADIQKLNFKFIENSPQNFNLSNDYSMLCENMKCTFEDVRFLSKFQFVEDDNQLVSQLADVAKQTVTYTVKPESIVLKDGSTQNLDAAAVTAKHEFTLEPEAFMQKQQDGVWKIWWKNGYAFFDGNGKMYGPNFQNYTADEVRILENLHSQIISNSQTM